MVHTASPVVMAVKKSEGMARIITPAVEGVRNVLGSATRVGGVRRIVMTSSVAAVVGDNFERGPDHVFTEDDWDLLATDDFLQYHR